jgi:DNA-binding NarL/FixJ family response regulator
MAPHGQSRTRERAGRDLFLDHEWLRIAAALNLTRRQLEIVRCLFDNDVQSGIAQRLGVSEHTVHTHVERLYRKLGVSSRCELLIRLFREYLAVCSRGRRSEPALEPTLLA